MKNSNQSGIGSSIRRSVSILLIFAALAITNVSGAADIKNSPANNGANSSLTPLSDRVSIPGTSQGGSVDGGPEGAPRLTAEYRARFCVTIFGTFPLDEPMPA